MRLKYSFFLLAVLVFLSVLLPITVFAAGLDSHNFATDNIYMVRANETLSVDQTVPSRGMLAIYNGATLTIGENVTLTIAPGGTVTISDGQIDVRYAAKIETAASFIWAAAREYTRTTPFQYSGIFPAAQ